VVGISDLNPVVEIRGLFSWPGTIQNRMCTDLIRCT